MPLRIWALAALLAIAVPAIAQDRLDIGGSQITVRISGDESELSRPEILAWIAGCARAVNAYYGRFPVRALAVHVQIDDRAGPHGGVTNGWPAPNIRIRLGRGTTRDQLAADWVMTHEMIHTAFPNVDRERHAWAEEGLATFVEPVARFRGGTYSREQLWLDLVRGLPQGLPQPGDRGLDRTPTWGRTYWGGALFWLLADVEIRQRTGNAMGLENALRGILAAGGNISADWPLGRALASGDRVVGVSVLAPLHARMAETAAPVDLGVLWRKLGIRMSGRSLIFDDTAPLAAVRRGIEGVVAAGTP